MKIVYSVIIIFVVVFIYLFIAQNYGENREEEFFTRFDTTDINGVLEYAKVGYHGSVFKIEEIDNEFVFYPYIGELNNKIFYNVAEKGDVIIKKAHSDILRLKKKDTIYQYKFRKPSH